MQNMKLNINMNILDITLYLRPISTLGMYFFHFLYILHWKLWGGCGVGHKECIMCVSSRMLLGLKQSVEIPEGVFNVIVGGHLRETHFQENLSKFSSNIKKRVEIARLWSGTFNKKTLHNRLKTTFKVLKHTSTYPKRQNYTLWILNHSKNRLLTFPLLDRFLT